MNDRLKALVAGILFGLLVGGSLLMVNHIRQKAIEKQCIVLTDGSEFAVENGFVIPCK